MANWNAELLLNREIAGVNSCHKIYSSNFSQLSYRSVLHSGFTFRVYIQGLTSQGVLKPLYPGLLPRPHPAFCRLQYGKVGRAWYLFSREHDVINKWRKKFKTKTRSLTYCSNNYKFNACSSRPPLARYVW